jgi:alkylation response protein AidB-like acyl-CoA dehydrogenase
MDLRFTPEEQAFREEVRSFIRENLPKDIRERMYLGDKASKEDIVTWQRILNKRGWATYSWPQEHGGPGWTAVQKMIFLEENLLAPAPELSGFNITMLGPVLIQFGTEAQKKKFLPRAANLDDWWCQGFSEPGAGSDLASLRTTAVRDGDHYVINGSKIWTSTAHVADWVFLLVRTNPNARKKQEGISFILLDMRTPGVTVRPIISIDGAHHLNETFYDNVRVPVENLVHEENKGWDVAKFLLGNERVGIARLGKSRERIEFAKSLARQTRAGGKPLAEDPAFRQRVAQLEVDLKGLEMMQLRVVSAYDKRRDGKPDPLSSAIKVRGSELSQAASELVVDIGGPQSMTEWARDVEPGSNEPALGPEWAAQAAGAYLMLRAASIYGGSNEIQRNIVAKAILGL